MIPETNDFDKLSWMLIAIKGTINKEKNEYIFNLYDGFKLTLLENGDIEKLEFAIYNLQFEDRDFKEYSNSDKNTSNFLEDILFKDYLNVLIRLI